MMSRSDPPAMRIISTGGTFEKVYDPLKGQLSFGQSHLSELCLRARMSVPYVIDVLMLVDSLDMTEIHRQQILAACTTSEQSQIVIVHGTDTMAATAEVLGQADLNKTIVLTGAMVPYEVRASDAMFNLGFATAAAQIAPVGVYVAMNGALFDWNRVRKNRDLGRFEAG